MPNASPQNQKGQIIIIALVVLAIFLVMSASLVGYTTYQVENQRKVIAEDQALQLAEAGVDQAVYQLNQNSSYAGETDTALGPGTFSTAITSIDPNHKIVTATGYVPNSGAALATRAVKVSVTINSSLIFFNTGMQVGNGGVVMDNGSEVSGNVFSNGNIVGSGTLSAGQIDGDAIVAAGVAVVPDQSWIVQNSDYNFGKVASSKDVAQGFSSDAGGNLYKVSVYLKKTGSPSDLAVKILSDNNGKPSKTVLGSGTIAASSVANSYNFVDGFFSSAVSLTPEVKYWILLSPATVDNSNYYSWGIDTGNGYANGIGMNSNNWSANNPAWNISGGDYNFETFMGGVTTKLDGVRVGGNVRVDSLNNCTVGGQAYYNTVSNCTITGAQHPGNPPPSPQPMPISDAQVQSWEQAAAAGGVIAGPYTVNGTVTMGPKEINGDLTISNGSTLNLTGPIWVKGSISFATNSHARVDSSLGNLGTVLIADNPNDELNSGLVSVASNATVDGSGSSGSFLMIISQSSNSNALSIGNNATGAIFYAPHGTVVISNNAGGSQIAGYQVHLSNNSILNFNSGLQYGNFFSGSGGSWQPVVGSYSIVK